MRPSRRIGLLDSEDSKMGPLSRKTIVSLVLEYLPEDQLRVRSRLLVGEMFDDSH